MEPLFHHDKVKGVSRRQRTMQLHPQEWRSELLPGDGGDPVPVVNFERSEEVIWTLINTYLENGFPYNLDSTRLPHDERHMPPDLPRGGEEEARFYLQACYYMRGTKSVEGIKGMTRLYANRPDLFDYEVGARQNEDELAEILKNHSLGFQNTVAGQWVENAKRMLAKYDGSTLGMFDEVHSYEDSLDRVRNDGKGDGLKGFQHKMTSMLLYYLMDKDLITQFNYPIPIDLHVMRVSIANRMIEFPGVPHGTNLFNETTKQVLRDLYFNFANRHDVNPQVLCNAVWLLGAAICGTTPGNITLSPLGRDNGKGRSTVLIPNNIDFRDPVQIAQYEASCRECPIQDTCEYNIPGKHNNVTGTIFIRGKRVIFPAMPVQPTFFD